jgi:hypothetical protein
MNALKFAIGVPVLAVALVCSGAASAAHGGHAGGHGGGHGGGGHMGDGHGFGGHGHGGFRGVFLGGVFFAGGPWYWNYYDTWPFYDDYLAQPESMAPAYIEQGENPEQPANASWYYCSNPPGYYPYVQSCASGWQRVQPNLPPGMY